MESPKRRIIRLESQVQGDEITLFEQLVDESFREREAAARGIPFQPRPFAAEVVRTFTEILADPELDNEIREAIRGALEERGHL